MICFCISERGRCHQAHLLLTGENISRTTWLAARMLGKDPEAAQAAAAELRTHLCSVAPAKRTSFEATFFEDADLYANLERFADEAPPKVVWRGQGRFTLLFLATRFLANPDHVPRAGHRAPARGLAVDPDSAPQPEAEEHQRLA